MTSQRQSQAKHYVGVMTGTSLDAIDVALIRLSNEVTLGHVQPSITLTGLTSRPLDGPLAEALLELQTSGPDELHRSALVANALADAIGRSILEAISLHGLRSADIVAAGVHGQTIRHQPQLGYTIQLNAPARIAETTGITVISDFRSRDIAAGGQGAPLVPAFHRAIFGQDPSIRAVVNIGGIANITLFNDALTGFDTGPGNMLLNHWAQQHLGQPFDRQGSWAASGHVDQGLLNAMLADPFFSAPAPKSTGRDHFGGQWLEKFLQLPHWASLPRQDVQATLTSLTAQTIASAIKESLATNTSGSEGPEKILVCGGGVHNTELMRRIGSALNTDDGRKFLLDSTQSTGWPPQAIEAAAFAWLAAQTMAGLPGNCPEVTGALGPRVLGAITPA